MDDLELSGSGFRPGPNGLPMHNSGPDADMKGQPGPNGEEPSSGKWVYESKGAGGAKRRWKWKPKRKPSQGRFNESVTPMAEEMMMMQGQWGEAWDMGGMAGMQGMADQGGRMKGPRGGPRDRRQQNQIVAQDNQIQFMQKMIKMQQMQMMAMQMQMQNMAQEMQRNGMDVMPPAVNYPQHFGGGQPGKGQGRKRGPPGGGGGGGGGGFPGDDPNFDPLTAPGPMGEDPSTGRWLFESKGSSGKRRWRWKSTQARRDGNSAPVRVNPNSYELDALNESLGLGPGEAGQFNMDSLDDENMSAEQQHLRNMELLMNM